MAAEDPKPPAPRGGQLTQAANFLRIAAVETGEQDVKENQELKRQVDKLSRQSLEAASGAAARVLRSLERRPPPIATWKTFQVSGLLRERAI